MHLNHTVIFFDECDELFRERSTETSARNILSFATASMLPKLQDLHDAQRVLFFLGTNYLSNVDTAIKREGRFDHTLFFDRPDDAAREIFIENEWKEKKNEQKATCTNALAKAVRDTTGWSISDVIAYAKAEVSGKAQPAPNIADYLNWIKNELKTSAKNSKSGELNSSRFGDAEKKAIRARWEAIIKHSEKTKETGSATPRSKVLAKGRSLSTRKKR
jgi:SpoVK/Ycf46/Vps4 family AAA+-type ATPase